MVKAPCAGDGGGTTRFRPGGPGGTSEASPVGPTRSEPELDLTVQWDEEQPASILERLLDGILGVDPAGRIVYANPAALAIFGYRREELLGAPLEVLVPERVRGRHAGLRRGYQADPYPRAMGGGLELTAVRRDGSVFPVEVSLSPGGSAASPVTTAVIRDVSRQREAEDALRVSEHQLALAEQIAHLGSWREDLRTGAVVWSAELYRLLDVDPGDPGGAGPSRRLMLDRLHPEDRDSVLEQLAAAWSQPGVDPDPIDVRVRPAGGPERIIALRCHLDLDRSGRPTHCYGTALDVTRPRQRAARDRHVADVLQKGLLPAIPRQLGSVAIATRYVPVGVGVAVGGDWADVFRLPDGLIGFAVGDVAGHGVESAATMVRLQQALRVLAVNGDHPHIVVGRLNQALAGSDHFGPDIELATLIYGQLNPATGRIRYCNAGHPPLIAHLAHSDPAARPGGSGDVHLALDTDNLPLGVLPFADFTDRELHLPRGGTVIAYTDGLIERRGTSIDETLATLVRLLDTLDPYTAEHPESLADALLVHLAAPGTRDDDTAVLVLKVPDPTGGADRL